MAYPDLSTRTGTGNRPVAEVSLSRIKAAAAFLVRMLRRNLLLGAAQGPITAIDFETRESGNLLDDLEVTLRHEQQVTRLLLSVKSSRQLTKAGFNGEFVSRKLAKLERTGSPDRGAKRSD
jgi:hypothetical protein